MRDPENQRREWLGQLSKKPVAGCQRRKRSSSPRIFFLPLFARENRPGEASVCGIPAINFPPPPSNPSLSYTPPCSRRPCFREAGRDRNFLWETDLRTHPHPSLSLLFSRTHSLFLLLSLLSPRREIAGRTLYG